MSKNRGVVPLGFALEQLLLRAGTKPGTPEEK